MTEDEALAVLLFEVGSLTMAVDLRRVVEISLRTEVVPLPGVQSPVTGVVRWRGRPLMAVALRERLGLPDREAGLFDHFVVVYTGRRFVTLEIDRVLDVTAIPRSEITRAPPSARPITGVMALPGGVHYVVDLEALLQLEQERAFDQALARLGEEATS